MQETVSKFLRSVLAVALLLAALPAAFSQAAEHKAGVSPDEALARLKAGAARFVKGERRAVNLTKERDALVQGQQPYAIVLSCSDSRVAPEIVFDESLGRLFVVRVAGNVTDPVTLGSIEYAAEHLGARLLLVLGHQSCGAVKATLDGGHVPPNIESILHRIQPAADKAKTKKLSAAATLDAAIVENVWQQVRNATAESGVLREMVQKQQFRIEGAVYSLATGNVGILKPAPK